MTINVDNTDRAVGLILALITLSGIMLGWIRVIRPRIHNGRKEVVAVRDAILGREPITDSITGKEIAPAIPGMGVRMASTEEKVEKLAEAMTALANAHLRFDDHEDRIKALEQAAVERVVTKVESAQAWRTIEKAIQADPVPDELPDL